MAVPSEADRLTTYRIMELTGQLGFTVIDHIIIAGEDACSMLNRGSLPEYRPGGGILRPPAAEINALRSAVHLAGRIFLLFAHKISAKGFTYKKGRAIIVIQLIVVL